MHINFFSNSSFRRYLYKTNIIWVTAVPLGSEYSHNVVQMNHEEVKLDLLAPCSTSKPPQKKFSPKKLCTRARNPNIDLQPKGIFSKSNIQHHIQKQQFHELLTKTDKIQRQSIDQNLRKLVETAELSDNYTQDYNRYFKDIKGCMYMNGEIIHLKISR